MTDGDIKLTVDLEPGDVEQTAERLKTKIKGIFDGVSGKEVTTQFMSLQKQMASTYAKADQLQAKLHALQESGPINTKA